MTRTPETTPLPANCIKCGLSSPTVAFTWRLDQQRWRTTCKTCRNAKGYYKTYREKQRAEDPDGFRAHNTNMATRWKKQNPDAIKQHQRNRAIKPESKIKGIMTSAKARNIAFVTEDMKVMCERLQEPCQYCGHCPHEGEVLNGLDRYDPEGAYSADNTVPCCSVCNAMKGGLSCDNFINKIRGMVQHLGVLLHGSSPQSFGGHAELRKAPKKQKVDLLPLEVKVDFWSSACKLCGCSPCFGLDRIDSNADYTVDNVQPCCDVCNYIKKHWKMEEVQYHITRIFLHTQLWTLRDVSQCSLETFNRRQKEPVLAVKGDMTIAFPSMCKASEIIGVQPHAIVQAVKTGGRVRGWTWQKVHGLQYQMQHMAKNEAHRLITMLRGLQE